MTHASSTTRRFISGGSMPMMRLAWTVHVARSLGLLVFVLSNAPALASSGHPTPVVHRELTGDVHEYIYTVVTGPGVHDKIGVHRVVQLKGGEPIESEIGILLAHGDAWGFDGAFQAGTSSPVSLPVYLAEKGVDVWGIDFGWTLVPIDTTDFTFMRNWGLQRDINDLEKALRFARNVRKSTGSGDGPLSLLGWSRGGWVGYGLLNQESQKPMEKRQVKGFVSVDNFFKTDDLVSRDLTCDLEAQFTKYLEDGRYNNDLRALSDIGVLAITDPDGISPYYGEPYTNLTASLTLGAASFQFGRSFTPFYHFVAGRFPEEDIHAIPRGLRFTNVSRWNEFLVSASPYEALRMQKETYGISCDATSGPFDNHLGDIAVPVLYVGAAGGFGKHGLYTLGLLGSNDVQTHIVQLDSADNEAVDFGHADLFNAREADVLAWTTIHRWLERHNDDHGCDGNHRPSED